MTPHPARKPPPPIEPQMATSSRSQPHKIASFFQTMPRQNQSRLPVVFAIGQPQTGIEAEFRAGEIQASGKCLWWIKAEGRGCSARPRRFLQFLNVFRGQVMFVGSL